MELRGDLLELSLSTRELSASSTAAGHSPKPGKHTESSAQHGQKQSARLLRPQKLSATLCKQPRSRRGIPLRVTRHRAAPRECHRWLQVGAWHVRVMPPSSPPHLCQRHGSTPGLRSIPAPFTPSGGRGAPKQSCTD